MPDLTFTLTTNANIRLKAWAGHELGLGGPSTATEAKEYIIKGIKSRVRQYERGQLEAVIVLEPDVDIT